MEGEDDSIQSEILHHHQKEIIEQRQLHLYQLKTLQGQLLDNLISQVSNPTSPVNSELEKEILKSLKLTNEQSTNTRYSPVAMTTPGEIPGNKTNDTSFNSTSGCVDPTPQYEGHIPYSKTYSISPSQVTLSLTTPTHSHSLITPSLIISSSPEMKPVSEPVIRSPLSPRCSNSLSTVPQKQVLPVSENHLHSTSMEYWENENETLRDENGRLNIQVEQLNKYVCE